MGRVIRDLAKVRRIGKRLASVLSDDLLEPKRRGSSCPVAGHCFVCVEALWVLVSGEGGPWATACLKGVKHEGSSHWWLRRDDGAIVDPTAAQFVMLPPYHLGRPCGRPGPRRGKVDTQKHGSARARLLIARAAERYGDALFR